MSDDQIEFVAVDMGDDRSPLAKTMQMWADERALTDDLFAWIETARPGGTKAQLNALDDLKARYRKERGL